MWTGGPSIFCECHLDLLFFMLFPHSPLLRLSTIVILLPPGAQDLTVILIHSSYCPDGEPRYQKCLRYSPGKLERKHGAASSPNGPRRIRVRGGSLRDGIAEMLQGYGRDEQPL